MTGADRRPWLILSQAEAEALAHAARRNPGRPSKPLARALHQVDLQVAWIEHGDGPEPTPTEALERESAEKP